VWKPRYFLFSWDHVTPPYLSYASGQKDTMEEKRISLLVSMSSTRAVTTRGERRNAVSCRRGERSPSYPRQATPSSTPSASRRAKVSAWTVHRAPCLPAPPALTPSPTSPPPSQPPESAKALIVLASPSQSETLEWVALLAAASQEGPIRSLKEAVDETAEDLRTFVLSLPRVDVSGLTDRDAARAIDALTRELASTREKVSGLVRMCEAKDRLAIEICRGYAETLAFVSAMSLAGLTDLASGASGWADPKFVSSELGEALTLLGSTSAATGGRGGGGARGLKAKELWHFAYDGAKQRKRKASSSRDAGVETLRR
jgi:hypothetical protein